MERELREFAEGGTESADQSTVHSTNQSNQETSRSANDEDDVSDSDEEDLSNITKADVDQALSQVEDQPEELYDWSPKRQSDWFKKQLEKIMPVTLTREETIPFFKTMQINKIMHPRLNTNYLERRRELYRAQDWDQYAKCVKQSFQKSIQIAQSGYKAMSEVLGLDQGAL